MIVVQLVGGLGNQLFQYAMGRKLSLLNNIPLKLDTVTGFSQDDVYKRCYRLDKFAIKAEVASPSEIQQAKSLGSAQFLFKNMLRLHNYLKVPPLCKLGARLLNHKKKYYLKETSMRYNPFLSEISLTQAYLEGYWQSEKYFVDIKSMLQKELSVNTPLQGLNHDLAKNISSSESVCLHCRRLFGYDADGNRRPEDLSKFGVTDLSFYDRAIEILSKKHPALKLFIFSDDPSWAKEHINYKYPSTFIDGNMDKEHEDLRLMSLCKHQIVPNSTFSWWGAWLNTYPNKTIITPAVWRANEAFNSPDLLPGSWITI
ncbi:MAG: alpha-1,2-fucosyltransferase [Fibrobacteria bacterium]|nr:alpha-1,2-fucosyltransferase [Fibrobacteria bacterium]